MTRFGTHGRAVLGRRWKWLRRFFVLVMLAGLGAGGYYVVGFTKSSDEFDLTTVRLDGLKVLTEEEVLVASGVSSGDSVLELNRDAIKAGIESLPYVESADVVIVFPDTMIIRVQERTPAATLIVRNTAYELDARGVVLRRCEPGTPYFDPIITNVSGLDVVEAGDVLELPALQNALKVWEVYRTTQMAAEVTVSEIAAKSPDEIVLILNELPFEIRWGRGDFATAAQRLDVLWQEQDGELGCTEYLDLRFGEDIVCK